MHLEEEFRVEQIEPCRLISHSDFITLPHLYTLRRLGTEGTLRLRLPKRRGWRVGEVLRLSLPNLLLSAV